jgi:outer membrane protein, heavy metal efflux system
MLISSVRSLAVSVLVLISGAAFANELPLTVASLSLREALARTLRDNPELQVFSPAKRVAEAERLQADLRPNPVLGLEHENFGSAGQARDEQATTLTLSQVIELGGKRDLRSGAADAAINSVNADYDIARLDALAEASRRFIDLVQSQAQIALADRAVALAQSVAQAVEKRIRAGAASSAERNRAAVELLKAEIDAASDRAEADSKRISLAAMWGRPSADFATVQGELRDLPTLGALAPLLDELQQSPAFARFAAERRLREAEMKLARAQAVPDLTVSFGVRRFSAANDYGLVASLNMPLPLANRNQGEVAASAARIAVNETEREAAHLRIRAVLYGLYQQAVQTRHRATALDGRAVPEAEQALVLTQRGFANGRFSFLELADAQRQVLQLRSAAIDAFADAHRLDAEIERLTGRPILALGRIAGESS